MCPNKMKSCTIEFHTEVFSFYSVIFPRHHSITKTLHLRFAISFPSFNQL